MTTPAPTGTTASLAVRGIFVLGAVFALREARSLLAPVLIAIVLTFVLAPAVRWLRRRGVPDMLAALIMVMTLIVGTVPVVTSLAQPAALWWQTAPETVARLLERLDKLRSGIPGLGPAAQSARAAPPARLGAPAAPAPPDPIKEKIASEGLSLTGTLLGHGVSFVVSCAATLILLYFLLASEHWMLSRMVEAMPRRRVRALVLSGVRAAQRQIGRYLVALGCINAVVGACTASAMWMLGVPNPVLWGVVAFVLQFVPYIGPLIVTGLLLVVGVTSFVALPDMLAPALTFLLIHAVESNLVSPWIVGRRLSLSPVSVFL